MCKGELVEVVDVGDTEVERSNEDDAGGRKCGQEV